MGTDENFSLRQKIGKRIALLQKIIAPHGIVLAADQSSLIAFLLKKILPLFAVLLSSFHAIAQRAPVFPKDFAAGAALFPGMKLRTMPADAREEGLADNPAVVRGFKAIDELAPHGVDARTVAAAYYEVYYDPKEKGDDAGVIVLQYPDRAALRAALPTLPEQENLNYLYTNDANYLIVLWSDWSQKSDGDLARLVRHYTSKLAVKLFIPERQVTGTTVSGEKFPPVPAPPQAERSYSTTDTIYDGQLPTRTSGFKDCIGCDTVSIKPYDDGAPGHTDPEPAGPVDPADFYTIGFGTVPARCLTTAQAADINDRIAKLQKQHGIHIAFEALHPAMAAELTDDQKADYASHIIWTDPARQKNHVVMFFQQGTGKTWLFFGKGNAARFRRIAPDMQRHFESAYRGGNAYTSMLKVLSDVEVACWTGK